MPKIPVLAQILNLNMRPMKTPEMDADGEPVEAEKACSACGRATTYMMRDASTLDMIGIALSAMPPTIRRDSEDGPYLTRIAMLLHNARRKGLTALNMPEGDFDWLFGAADGSKRGMLQRRLPAQAGIIMSEDSEEKRTFASGLWASNAHIIVTQLRTGALPAVDGEDAPASVNGVGSHAALAR